MLGRNDCSARNALHNLLACEGEGCQAQTAVLQDLINEVNKNDKLSAFKRKLQGDLSDLRSYLFLPHRSNLSEVKLWLLCSGRRWLRNPLTPVSSRSTGYMTFIRFVDSIWMIYMKFLDLRLVGIEGATFDNLVKNFKQLLHFDLFSVILWQCGAGAMLGRINSVDKHLENEIGIMTVRITLFIESP